MTDRELMQQALDAFEKIVDGCRGVKSANPVHKDARDLATFVIVDCREPIKSISDRLAQPEPKPVAWRNTETGEFSTGGFLRNKLGQWMPLYTSLDWAAIYTAPPQREWQGLTDEEIEKLYLGSFDEGQFAHAIEAKLKEKNT